MSGAHLSLVVALPAEARPVNRHFDLQRDNRRDGYPLYTNEGRSLVISGIGKEHAFAATSWLYQAKKPSHEGIWLNLGIAGHPERRLGEAVIASEIIDQASNESWQLNPPAQAPFDCDRLITLPQPGTSYRGEALHDMEAAGFYSAAHQFASAERILVIKIITDNCDNPVSNINGKMVSRLIEQQLDKISLLIKGLD